jgi:ABC-type sulfate transport system permease component
MSCLAALAVVLAGVALGIVLFLTDHPFFGFIAFLIGLPMGLGVFVMMRDRL